METVNLVSATLVLVVYSTLLRMDTHESQMLRWAADIQNWGRKFDVDSNTDQVANDNEQ